MLIRSELSLSTPKVQKICYFFKQQKTENSFYLLKILGPNDAVGTFDSGEIWGYELVEMNYYGEYRDHVDIGAYNAIIEKGFTEISKGEFMQLVEEKYPGWRTTPENEKILQECYEDICN
jgi:hypothetical protein